MNGGVNGNGNGNRNGNGDDHREEYAGKTDHEVILILETQVQSLIKNLDKSERDNERLYKTQGQISVVRLVFIGVMGLIFSTVIMTVVSWWSPKGSLGLEKELQFYERLLLVMMGILSSAVVALYDQRNGKNGD
jgi:hypothetical protein